MKSSIQPLTEKPFHSIWVRIAHWIITLSFFALVFTGIEMTMVHPRFYWGEVGNDLTPSLFELPVSRNYKHGGWEKSIPFYENPNSPVSASRTYDIFNQNGWGRSLHFLAGWFLVIPGVFYILLGLYTGHFKKNIWPGIQELSPSKLWADLKEHFRVKIPVPVQSKYGLMQKCSYAIVIFIFMPLIIMTGMTMSPAITAAYPFLLKLFLGAQSARTVHFILSAALVGFFVVHVMMVIRFGFKKQMSLMIKGH
ncbi:MAG: cytochrome b/b6 domain-containing protein [Saprospiraceae bacterium]|nr:cytochrome b/b6 domain-containing protein [Saprospiraceae bacterium]